MMKVRNGHLLSAVVLTALVLSGCGATTVKPATTGTAVENSTAVNNGSNSTTSANATAGYTKYTNDRFQFSVSVPDTFVEQAASQNNDGQSWSSADQSSSIRVSGSNNVLSDTVKSVLQQHVQQNQPSYQQSGSNWFVMSGTKTGNNGQQEIFYEKTYVGAQFEYSLTISYPASQKDQYDAVVSAVSDSFTPGPLN